MPKGNYIASLAGGCSASLAYSVTLVRPGEVKFMYQYTDDDAVFHFLVSKEKQAFKRRILHRISITPQER